MFKATALIFTFAIFANPAFATVKWNQEAPDFKLKSSDGKEISLSKFRGKPIVLEWFNKDCPYVRKFYDSKTMQDLQKTITSAGDVVWLTIVSSKLGKEGHLEAAEAEEVRKAKGMASTYILLDEDGKVGKLYGAKTTPHMFVIDKEFKIFYQGAIDDKPSANALTLKGAKNYVVAAMKAIQDGKPLKEKERSTTPYGCSVKY